MDDPKPTIIKIMGLGGGGSNAVNRMIDLGLEGVDFIAANTDIQALAQSLAPARILLGQHSTRGLGAGGKPEIGEFAADESRDELKQHLAGADMVFLTAGMGGGTGTGAIPIAAEVARSVGALAVAVVTIPFTFEASRRRNNADAGLAKLKEHADCLIMVPNDKLLGLLPRSTPLDVALRVADEVLRQGVQGITELITKPGLINIDFANIKQLMQTAGTSMMAIGQGKGEHKAVDAVRQALQMPLLDLHSVSGANGILVHFTGGEDLALSEVNQAASELTNSAPGAEVLFGATIDPTMAGRCQVILVATGLDAPAIDVLKPDLVFRRPIHSRRPAERPAPGAAESPSEPVEHVGAASPDAQSLATHAHRAPEPSPVARVREPGLAASDVPGNLAAALFSQVAARQTGSDGNEPLQPAAPMARVRVESPEMMAAQNSLDLPAFLRRRRTLRDLEGNL